MRLMALFTEREARDEMGIAAIRDAISDQLFPGTSTIQTRLRYFLFVPWVFEALEARGIRAATFAAEAKKAEADLLEQLVRNSPEGTDGIIGRRAGSLLKRMPSSVYWSGLASWGIRSYGGSLQQYMLDADARRAAPWRRRETDAVEFSAEERSWHTEAIRLRPQDFPADTDVFLTREEAVFLLERWRACNPDSLLTWLALRTRDVESPPEAERIWEHAYLGEFPASTRHLIAQGQQLDALIRGAVLLYNLQLAELDDRPARVEEYLRKLDDWAKNESSLIRDWHVADLWACVMNKGHAITNKTRRFVEEWLHTANEAGSEIRTSKRARALIQDRERGLKGTASRFDNGAARRQWGGAAGTMPLLYRWPTANTYLREWHAGWRSGK